MGELFTAGWCWHALLLVFGGKLNCKWEKMNWQRKEGRKSEEKILVDL